MHVFSDIIPLAQNGLGRFGAHFIFACPATFNDPILVSRASLWWVVGVKWD